VPKRVPLFQTLIRSRDEATRRLFPHPPRPLPPPSFLPPSSPRRRARGRLSGRINAKGNRPRRRGDSIKIFSRGPLRRDFPPPLKMSGGKVRGIWEGGEGWKAPPFRLPCRFSDYRALISTSGQIKLDDHDDDDDDDDAEERRKGKSALGARERGVGVVYPVELLGVRHSFRGGLRIPGVPPFDPIASCPGLPPAYVFTPDFFSPPRVPPARRLIIGFHGRNLPEIPRRTAIALYPRLRNYRQRSGLAPDSSSNLTLDLANSPVKIDRMSVQCGS